MFYIALPCLLLAIILIYRMRRMSLEGRKLRYEVDISQSSPTSIEAWRAASEASLRASHARRGMNGDQPVQEEDRGSVT